nr:hypothetical protein [Mycoplasmopsis bovis]
MVVALKLLSREVRGFKKTTEYTNLNSLVNSLYWRHLMDEDETKNKEAFINTFKYHVTKFANEQFSNYENIEKYIKKITLRTKGWKFVWA